MATRTTAAEEPQKKTAAKKATAKKTTAKKAAPHKTTAKKASKPTKNLLIVESPSKAKTIKKYLGSKYEVLSSKGHIRDLPASRLGVDIENGFTPEYIIPRKDGKAALLKELKTAAKNSKSVYLATDPDREGEAIAWHLAQLLELDADAANRVTFNEVTRKAVTEGIKTPRVIDKDLVASQQTRRVLDRIVGYKLSPFLWHKVKYGLSAGRVQSVATRWVVDREREIEAFVPQEYWNLDAAFRNGAKEYTARFYGTADGKVTISSAAENQAIRTALEGQPYKVASLKEQEKFKQPAPPFTTFSLLQDASVHLNMAPQKTMSVAQALYEGIDVAGHGLIGLITYMRTDSLRVSDEARESAKAYIIDAYGEKYYPKAARVFKTPQGAQDAHEAIRPTDINLTPASIRKSLTNDQYRLYKLIWERFTASQMAAVIQHVRSVEIEANGYFFRASDTKKVFDGYSRLYRYSEESEETSAFPDLKEGDALDFKELISEQKFTQPPSRYTEASLIKALKENGIGRPSTVAPIVGTILERDYVEREGKALKPTQLGIVTTDLMIENFENIVDSAFTAEMEKQLDSVEEGSKTSLEVLNSFYGDFAAALEKAEANTERRRVETPIEESDEICELCGRKMVYKVSRFGRFLACPGYPECKNTKPVYVKAAGTCPTCGKGLVVRKTQKGKTYYSCESGAACGFRTWDIPTNETCPKCGKTLFRHFGNLVCVTEGCGYETAYKKPAKTENEEQ
ncbi:MAG: type I DNA topoisomerase [Clostridia bacterium]|nr:type I DNA topoisomerase [Clostridia bacterium]